MMPADFVSFVHRIAEAAGFPADKLMLGGDHLGPLVWRDEPFASAMQKAIILVRQYVLAGFKKLHLDASMPCGDDQSLHVETIARRTAELAEAAEQACQEGQMALPVYVIGSEVPFAGGSRKGEQQLSITRSESASETIEKTRQAFYALGLHSAWERVVALVVQPGVEFGSNFIHDYQREVVLDLSRFIETIPRMVYEAHSTDFQTSSALRQMVEDHFAILKVGPALTFALREAVFALAACEEILMPTETSHLLQVLEEAMLVNPSYWHKHYTGNAHEQKFARQFSLIDRIRYYWAAPQIHKALIKLFDNLGEQPLPLPLISQYFPVQYRSIREGRLTNTPRQLLDNRIQHVIDEYLIACKP